MDKKTFVKVVARNEHLQQRCPLKDCPEKFGHVADAAVIARIQQHLIEDHNVHRTEGRTCPLCGHTYAALRGHIRRAHLAQKISFAVWKERLKWHVPFDDSQTYYTCRQCGKRTKNRHSLKFHVKFHLKNPVADMWPYKRTLQPEPVDVSVDEVQHQQSRQLEDTEHCNITDVKPINNDGSNEAISAGVSDVYFTKEHQKISIGNAVQTSQDGAIQNVSDVIDLDSESEGSQCDNLNDSDVLIPKEENAILDNSCDDKCPTENGLLSNEELEEIEKEELSQDDVIEEIERFMQEEDQAARAQQELKHIHELET